MVKKKEIFFIKYKEEIFNILFVISNILIVAFFYKNLFLISVLLFLIGIIGLYHWKSKKTLILFILGGFTGAIAEMFCVHFGVWKYPVTDLGNIPIWLFIAWGNATALIYQGSKYIKGIRLK